MCGPSFCSMKITQDVRDYAREKGIENLDQALQTGMEEKAVQFRDGGGSLYNRT